MSVTTEDLSGLALFEGCEDDDLRQVMSTITGVRRARTGRGGVRRGRSGGPLVDRRGGDGRRHHRRPLRRIDRSAGVDRRDGTPRWRPRDATVRAATELVLAEVDGDRFLDVLRASPRLTLALLRDTRDPAPPGEPAAPPTTAPSVAPPSPPVLGAGVGPRSGTPGSRAASRTRLSTSPRCGSRARSTGPMSSRPTSSPDTRTCDGCAAIGHSTARSRQRTRPMSLPGAGARR